MPRRASDYTPEQVRLARSTCLYVATKLGDLMDEIVVVGGLVPSLLIDQSGLPPETPAHVGTMDLDIGLDLAILDEGLYHTLSERLREAGFEQALNNKGRPMRQTWQIAKPKSVTVDFLISPSLETDRPGGLRNLESDFAAFIAPGLKLAFTDRRRIRIDGETPFGETAARNVWVCGPGAFVALKALAMGSRGLNKDAYDLYYVIRNFGTGVADVAACLRLLLVTSEAQKALEVLQDDFLSHDGIGPRSQFIQGGPDDEIQADVVSFVKQLVDLCS